MKYIRTKDGRILEEGKLESGLKQTSIIIIRKNDNKVLRQIICDDLDDYLEMVVVGEYCKCHKINPKDIKYETTTLFNEILKQADTIEELCDEFVFVRPDNYHDNFKVLDKDDKEYCIQKDYKIYGAIWTDEGLIYVAKMNEKGDLELI